VLSSRAVDGDQMHFGGSVVNKTSAVSIESCLPPPYFAGDQKVRNFASFETLLKFELPAFKNAARYPNSKTTVQCWDDRPMSRPSMAKLGPRAPEKALSVLTRSLKLARRNALYRR